MMLVVSVINFLLIFMTICLKVMQSIEKKHGKENTTLDRIDPYGDYERTNIRWATKHEQNQPSSKRNFKRVIATSPNGEIIVIENRKEFAKKYNISASEISKALKDNKTKPKGWSFMCE